jgi:hypothetical protein
MQLIGRLKPASPSPDPSELGFFDWRIKLFGLGNASGHSEEE